MTKEMELRNKESRIFRDEMLRNSFIWEDEVKDLYIPGTNYATTNTLAKAFNVHPQKIRDTYANHRGEFASDGICCKKSSDLINSLANKLETVKTEQGRKRLVFKDGNTILLSNNAIKLFPRDAILRLAMLLTDCNAAKIIRCMMVNEEIDFKDLPVTINIGKQEGINVRIDGEEIVTDSWNVAKAFGKQHKNILENIRSTKRSLEEMQEKANDSKVPSVFDNPNHCFKKIYRADSQSIDRVGYEITFNGFVLLVMGFTGKKAFGVKVRYINTFEAMRDELKRKTQKEVDGTVVANIAEIQELQNEHNRLKRENKILGCWQRDNKDWHEDVKNQIDDLKETIRVERERADFYEKLLKEQQGAVPTEKVIKHTGKIFDWNNSDEVYNSIKKLSKKVNRDEKAILKYMHNTLVLHYGNDIWDGEIAKGDYSAIYNRVNPKYEKKFEKVFKRTCKDFGLSLTEVV